MERKVINIERDFARYPAGRFERTGPYSGEAFRKNHLIPALKEGYSEIIIEFDGARGLRSSFLEEAFGGLVREGFDANDLLKRIIIHSQDSSHEQEIRDYILQQAAV